VLQAEVEELLIERERERIRSCKLTKAELLETLVDIDDELAEAGRRARRKGKESDG